MRPRVHWVAAIAGWALITPALVFSAATPWRNNPHGQVRLLSQADTAPRHGDLWLGWQFKPAAGWYVYWKFPGDSGYPPRMDWKGSSGFEKPEILWPAPTRFLLPGDITEYGYAGEVVYPVRTRLNGQPLVIKATLSYLTCNTSCVPYTYDFILKIPSGDGPVLDAEADRLIRTYRTRVPPPDRPDEAVMKSAPVVKKLDEQDHERRNTLGWILLLAFTGGLLLNVMPCVLPVLSIKLLGLVQQGGGTGGPMTSHALKVVRYALASAAGILASFLALAGAAITARSAGRSIGWGIQFQEPVFVAALMVIIIVFALNLWGVFEFRLPAFFGKLATLGQGDTIAGHFAFGLFATLLATPCSAPFLGTAMGFALSQGSGVILGIFAASGLGMAFPYVALAAVPQSVGWLPKPGHWMLHLKKILAVCLAGTAVWLGWVLYRQLVPVRRDVGQESALTWVRFDEERLRTLVAEGQSVFVDVTADWCVTCKYNENFVLNSPDVVRVFRERGIVMMRADWTSRDSRITAYLRRNNRAGVPFYAYYRPGRPDLVLSEFLTTRRVLAVLRES